MKKFLSIVAALFVSACVIPFAACEISDTSTNNGGSSSTENSGSSSTENSSSSSTENSSSSSTENSGSSSTENSGSTTDKTTVSFDSVTIVDNDNFTIIAESYEEDYFWGPAFKLYLENKTSDVTLMFSVTDAAVNGIMCDPYWAKELGSGLKTYSYVYFSSLEDNGINYIETVEMAIRVYDSDDWLADDYYNQTVTLSVQNSSTQSSTFNVTSQNGFNEVELVNSNGVVVKIIDFDEDYLFGPAFTVYVQNSTDKTLMVTADDVGVNGFLCDPYWATEVWAGKAEYSTMYWFNSTLQSNGIDSIETVTLTLRAYDSDNWLADDIVNISVTITVG